MTTSASIDTDRFSQSLRAKAVDLSRRKLLITNYRGTEQEADLSVPPNCDGFGRVRHFRRATAPGWPSNPLPIDPACRALGLSRVDVLEAQAFQNAVCNWRCWYCFVPFELLAAKPEHSAWLSAAELVDLYLAEKNRPQVIDLTGGQPDLIPEWVPWMMEALRMRGVDKDVFLWSDDNLSNDYYFQYLSDAQRSMIMDYKNYARVCCFKGFDATSFAFNTKAAPELFDRQFSLFDQLLKEGLDLYAYATFTTPVCNDIAGHMARFVDRLQTISEALPLRTTLLQIVVFTPVATRVGDAQTLALQNQDRARDAWLTELQSRYTAATLNAAREDITSVRL